MKRVFMGAALLLGGCSAHEGASFHDKLYAFANAGMVRVGDMDGALKPSQVHSPRECAVFTQPEARLTLTSYTAMRSLCVKDDRYSAEVAAAYN